MHHTPVHRKAAAKSREGLGSQAKGRHKGCRQSSAHRAWEDVDC